MSPDSLLPSGDVPAPRRADDTRDRLLHAAERLFAERGFEGTSMRAVTQAAGSSVSAVERTTERPRIELASKKARM